MNVIKKFKRLIRKRLILLIQILCQQQGSSLVIVAAGMVVILGMVALVTDVGLTYIQRQKLSNAVDASALAAAQDVTTSEQRARTTAQDYIQQNGFSIEDVQITVSSSMRSVEITGKDTVNFFFARVLGFDKTLVDAKAKAQAFPITGMTGVRPLAVEDFPFEYGVQYALKEGAGSSYNGNFGPLALGGGGANIYRDNIKYGYRGNLKVGDWVNTETGNMPNPTEEGIDYLMNQCTHSPKCSLDHYQESCSRIIPIPIVNSLHVDGRSDVQIVGFAMFLLEGRDTDGGKMRILGRFIKNTTVGDSDPSGRDYGLYAVKLVE